MPLFARVTLTPAILRSDRPGQTHMAVWIVACLILAFFGPLAWFVWGRHQHSSGSNRSVGA